MIRVLVVDDEAPARRKVTRLLAEAPDVRVVGEAKSGDEAVEAILDLKPDLVFLDVRMPGLDGFGVFETVGAAAMPLTVFVTAFDDHAVKAFEVQALDYVLKPVSPERFRTVLDRARTHLAQGATREVAARLEQALERLEGRRRVQRLVVRHNERAFLVPVESVDLFEAAGNYVRLHTGGQTHLIRAGIGTLAERLDPTRFLRLSRSEIVRLDAVKEFQPWFHGDQKVILKDGRVLTWSRRYRTRDLEEL